jgi:hypothetical protein
LRRIQWEEEFGFIIEKRLRGCNELSDGLLNKFDGGGGTIGEFYEYDEKIWMDFIEGVN